MKRGIAMALGLVCLAGCGSGQRPENQGVQQPAPPAVAAPDQVTPQLARGPAPTSPPAISGRKRLGKGKTLAPRSSGPGGPPLLDPPSTRLPPGIVATGQAAPPPDRSPPVDRTDELSFDARRVFLGEIVKHTFRVNNSSTEVWTIQKDADILPNCGCSSLVPQSRTLQPGAETDVQVTIRTVGPLRKQGPFARGGKIVWTTAGGRRRATSLIIRGEVLGALASSPQILVFQPDEVRRGAVKELVFTGNAPLDWNTWAVTCTSPNFQIVGKTLPRDGAAASCKVKCLPPEGLETFQGEIRVQVQRSGSEGGPIVFSVPVWARQTVDLVISPPVAPVVFAQPSDRATVKLLLRGASLAREQLKIEAIDFPGCKATWKLTRNGESPTASLEVTLVRQAENKPTASEPALTIRLAGRKPITVPAVVVGPSLDMP